jgi:cytochrome c
MRAIRIALVFLIAVMISLALALLHPFGDAHLRAARSSASPLGNLSTIPANPRSVLVQKCADCHSDSTHVPWYGNLAPGSWLMERDILRGRQHMNISHWAELSPDEQQNMAAKIVQQTRTRSMPLLQYRLIHWNARITNADVQTLQTWARGSSPAEGAGSSATSSSTPGDATQGKAVFEKRCVGCHALEQNREGPRLAGVYGRAAGSAPQFSYSEALRKAHITWNEDSLERWLADPDTYIPGNNMEFAVRKPDERRNLIAYLKQLPTPEATSASR